MFACLKIGTVILNNISRTTVKNNDTIDPSFLELKLSAKLWL